MTEAARPRSLRANLQTCLGRPIGVGTLSRRDFRFLTVLGWILLAVGALGAYATASTWLEHGAARDTIQLTVATVIVMAISAWLRFLVRKHGHGVAAETAAAR